MANLSFVNPVVLLRAAKDRDAVRRKVLCDKKNISASEFFAADKAGGVKPRYVLRIRTFEFRGEKLCEFENVRYSIYRTYSTDDGITELYLTPRAGDNA